jgi:hypothetical protein
VRPRRLAVTRALARRALACVPLAFIVLAGESRSARAGDTDVCIDAYESAQLLRRDGKLREALDRLATCAAATCPVLTTRDCITWHGEVERALPTIVVVARLADRREVDDVRVVVDGQLVAPRLDGKAIAVNPGAHHFRFDRGDASVERDFTIREGEKNRVIDVDFPGPPQPGATATTPTAPSTQPTAQPHPPTTSPVPATAGRSPFVYVLGTLGLAAVGVGAVFEIIGNVDVGNLKNCDPTCDPSKGDSARRELVVGDITVGAGLVLTGIAAWMFFASSPSTASTAAVSIVPTHGGATGTLRIVF